MAATSARTYVDFVPAHKLVEEPEKQTLVVDLAAAGFKKEHLSVQIDSNGRLRISGERQLEGNKWSRFRKEFQVPKGCNTGEIRARFHKDLYIIMPILSPAEEPKVADAQQTDETEEQKKAAGYSTAQQTAAAEAEEEKKRQEEEDARRRPGQEEHANEEEDDRSEGVGGRGEAVAASTARPAYGLVRDRSKILWALLLAVVLALVGAAGMYAKYRLMDPSAEAAPADDHTVGLSDY